MFEPPIPVLRIFSEREARAFYLDCLGMRWDWEQRSAPGAPVYAQVSRGDLVLQLSEHPADATPGAAVFVAVQDMAAWRAELAARPCRHATPPLHTVDGGAELVLTDPFGNRLRFGQGRSGPQTAPAPPPLTRAQVRAEYLKARAEGTLPPSGEVG